ncbi:MAG: type III PLP-dependent enzyme [Gammaproteobacteria bacterium]|jgi:ornithine decarboxylase|nr:type III PLP-dependent enzyme [Gammaproteobacteria bacterium]
MPDMYMSSHQLLQQQAPEQPLYLFHRSLLTQSISQFQQGFPGLLTYAVKANPNALIIETMLEQGVLAYDVASLAEIALVQGLAEKAGQSVSLHYHNPIKSEPAIAKAWHEYGVRSFALDDEFELEKICRQIPDPSGTELSVRFVAPVKHQVVLDLNTKFGADVKTAIKLLRQVAEAGFKASLTFHPGTQCTDEQAYVDFIACAAEIAEQAGVSLHRLNVGGGFPASYVKSFGPNLERYFDVISQAVKQYFVTPPALVCEPGRGLVNDCVSLLLKVIHRRENNSIFLNDGIYGGLLEMKMVDLGWPLLCWRNGQLIDGPKDRFTVFGPTCDAIDVLPSPLQLPKQLAAGDYIEMPLMGAYSSASATQFNGFLSATYVTVQESSYCALQQYYGLPKASGL